MEYPDFIKNTGYGIVDGLHGVNCRHSYSPFYPGISTPRWTPEKLKEYKDKTYTFTGADGQQKTVDAFEASQIQRGLEGKVKYWKRRLSASESAKEIDPDIDVTMEKKKVRYWQKRTREFCEQTGLHRQYFREQIA